MTTLRKACIKKGARKLTLNKYKLEIKKSQEKTWLFLRKNPSSIHSKPGISFPSVFSSSFSFAFASLFSYFLYPIPLFTSSTTLLYFVAFVHYFTSILLRISQIQFLIFWTLYTSYNYSKYYQLIILNIIDID